MTHRFYKHKLLLDEGFPPRSYFPNVKDDLRKIGLPDGEVNALAVQLKRLIVTCF